MDNLQRPRVLGLLVGNIANPAGDAAIKYGQLFAELSRQCELVGVQDMTLRGRDRYENALRSLRWPQGRWREASRKNLWSFARNSQRARQIIAQQRGQIDLVLQHGAIFSADSGVAGPPFVVYTDFTYRLAQREDPWRDPFRDAGRRWAAADG